MFYAKIAMRGACTESPREWLNTAGAYLVQAPESFTHGLWVKDELCRRRIRRMRRHAVLHPNSVHCEKVFQHSIEVMDKGGFTLIEIIMAVMIMAIMMLISFFSFDAVVQSWRAGQEMSDAMGQADYVIDQVVSGLKSSYFPDTGQQGEKYGFQFTDDGEGPNARDGISWTKVGRALVGEECGFAESPHRVQLSVVENGQSKDVEAGLALKAWRIDLNLEEFDPEEDVAEMILSPRVVGMNCRMLDKDQPRKNEAPNWQDEWKFSNSIPKAVEFTLYLAPVKEDEEPIAVRRIIEIPLSALSMNPGSKDKSAVRSPLSQQQPPPRQGPPGGVLGR